MHADSFLANVLPADNKCLVNDNLEIERLEQENDHLFELLLSQDIVHICVNSLASHNDCRKLQQGFIDEYNENLMLKAELAKKGQLIEKISFDKVVLRCSRLENRNVNLELKLQHQKESFLNNKPLNNQNAPEILEFFKINKWQARDAHIDYIKYSREHTDILREIVEHARALRPLDSDLDSACKIVQRIQEVLVYVKDTSPSLTKPSEKLVAVTPLNKNKKVRSQPVSNTKNNRILRTTSSNMKNKVEDHPRSVKSKSNTTNRVIEPICNVNVKHTMLNANYELIYVKCNQCMYDANHDVVQIVLWYLDSECSKHMTRNRSQLINFVHKFLGTVRLKNDQIAKIMGYGDYPMGKVMISQVYNVEELGHNLFSVGQFCDSDLK
nr:integrase, catalytic region, zinc finger, CCHC-type, peptidase aspartic, catalytic [Tanacetum cinerariifolium]